MGPISTFIKNKYTVPPLYWYFDHKKSTRFLTTGTPLVLPVEADEPLD